jgi:hypothetical protein
MLKVAPSSAISFFAVARAMLLLPGLRSYGNAGAIFHRSGFQRQAHGRYV